MLVSLKKNQKCKFFANLHVVYHIIDIPNSKQNKQLNYSIKSFGNKDYVTCWIKSIYLCWDRPNVSIYSIRQFPFRPLKLRYRVNFLLLNYYENNYKNWLQWIMHQHAVYIGSKEFMKKSKNSTLDLNSFLFLGTIFFKPTTYYLKKKLFA